jgi:hypothetical protein
MVSDTVQEKIDFQEIKVQITDSYTKAIAKVEAVPDYLKDSYKGAMNRIDEMHIYDNAVYASSAAFDPATYKKLFESTVEAIDAFKTALVTFTKQTATSVMDSVSAAKDSLTKTTVKAIKTTQDVSVSSAVWMDSKFRIIDAFNWSLEKTAAVDEMVLGGRGQMVAVPVQGYVMAKGVQADNMITGGVAQTVVKDVVVDFSKKKAMKFVTAK